MARMYGSLVLLALTFKLEYIHRNVLLVCTPTMLINKHQMVARPLTQMRHLKLFLLHLPMMTSHLRHYKKVLRQVSLTFKLCISQVLKVTCDRHYDLSFSGA